AGSVSDGRLSGYTARRPCDDRARPVRRRQRCARGRGETDSSPDLRVRSGPPRHAGPGRARAAHRHCGRGAAARHHMNRILVVEDDRDIADLIVHYLANAGHEAQILTNGAEAMGAARRTPPDVLILDRMLPGADGLEICRAMRGDPATAGIPIIMLTARAEESDRIVGLELGADDYVTKPFSPKELVARVNALLRRTKRQAAEERILRYRTL